MNIIIKRQNTSCRTTRLSKKLPPTFRKNHQYSSNIQHKPLIASRCKASLQDIQTATYFVGKSIILFTMFYCSLNWWFYKTEREKEEEQHRDRD